MFKLVDPNKKYLPVKTALFYYVIGQYLLEFPIRNAMSDIDMRFSFGCCITSGHGKSTIRDVVRILAKPTRKVFSSVTSLHEEQLIGKQWYDKDAKEYIEDIGYFGDDFLIKDDALSLLNNSKFELVRNYFLTALDVWGRNRIHKRLVGERALSYDARCSFLYFMQTDQSIITENIATGLWRRAPILRIDLSDEEVKEILNKRLKQEYTPEPERIISFLKNIKNIKKIEYKNIDDKLLHKINDHIITNYYSNQPLQKALLITHQNNLLKFSYINALLRIYNPNNPYNPEIELDITRDDIHRAIEDYNHIHSAIKKFTQCNKSLPKHPIARKIVEILQQHNCTSEKKSILSSPALIKLVSKELNEPTSTVKYHFYNKLKEEGLIETKQITTKEGKTSSKVWLL